MALHKYFVSAEYGVMIGSTVYVLGQLFHLWSMPADTVNLTGLVLMSAIIGWLSLIFESPKGSSALLLAIHCGATFIVVLTTSYLCDWFIPYPGGWVSLLGIFVLVYVLVWIGLYLNSRITAREMNLQLKHRQNHP